MDALARTGQLVKLCAGLLGSAFPPVGALEKILTYLLGERGGQKAAERDRELTRKIAEVSEESQATAQQLAERIQVHEDWVRFLYENYKSASHPDRVALLRTAIVNILAGRVEPEWTQLLASMATTVTPLEAVVLQAADDIDREQKAHAKTTGAQAPWVSVREIAERLPQIDAALIDATILQLVGRGLLGTGPQTRTGIVLDVPVTPLGQGLSQMLRDGPPVR